MRSAYLQPDPDRPDASPRRRAGAFILTVLAHLLLLLLLLRLAPPLTERKPEEPPTSFSLLPDRGEAPKPAAQGKTTKVQPQKSGDSAKVDTPRPVAQAKPVETPVPPPFAPGVIPNSKALFDSFDLAKVQGSGGGRTGDNDGEAGDGKDSRSVYGPGEGSGGQRLYNAEWYREPSNSELNGYLPADAPPTGWGMVACRTIEDYHVDNCRSLGESPLGSGFARSLRLAAWQFRVRPPRLGGKPLIGAWVRIRIEYTQGNAVLK